MFHLRHPGHFPDEHRFDPAGKLAAYVPVCLGIALRAVADTDHLAPRQTRVDFLDALSLVNLRSARQRGQEAAQLHPGRFAQEDGPSRIVAVDELMEKRVEVVGRGREVEPSWLQDFRDVRVKRRHECHRGWWVDECRAENTHRGRSHGDFNRVVNICVGTR